MLDTMPLRCFVNQNSQGAKEQTANHSHEIGAVIEIIKLVYDAFNYRPNLYAIITNLNKSPAIADLVVITERGLGVVELKHAPGSISLRGTTWYASSKPIPGNPALGYRNPHEQVQLYAGIIRDQLFEVPSNQPSWLPGKPTDWEKFQFGTAVCFTNQEVTFERFPFWHYQKSNRNPHIKPWEQFSILTPAEIPGWVDALHFEAGKRHRGKFEPYRLMPDQIMRIIPDVFEATEWTELDKLTPVNNEI